MTPRQIHYKHSTVNLYEGDFNDLLRKEIGPRQYVIITDSNVNELYLAGSSFKNIISINPGESSKTLGTVSDIYSKLMEMVIDKDTVLVGIGGGVACDITGFVASTYKRGLPFGFIPTTLLAQADAAIGGKNGVNHRGIKNAIGLVRQPDFIIFDPRFLDTLPENELASGFAEVVKTSLIGSPRLFDLLENNYTRALSRDREILAEIIAHCIAIKAGITSQDELDCGQRQVLNFGHTVGHAIEAAGNLSHGQAISIGMMMAIGLSRKLCGLSESSAGRIKSLLMKFKLPVEFKSEIIKSEIIKSEIIKSEIIKYEVKEVISKLYHDKKINGDTLNFILLEEIGRPAIRKIRADELMEFLTRIIH